MDWLADPQVWMAFATLTVLEIVLGIDNVIFHRCSGFMARFLTVYSGA